MLLLLRILLPLICEVFGLYFLLPALPGFIEKSISFLPAVAPSAWLSSPRSEPGGVGRASISAAGLALKKFIIFDHAGSF